MHPRLGILLLAPEESPPRRSCPMAAKWAAQGVETNSKTGPESRPGVIGAASPCRRGGPGNHAHYPPRDGASAAQPGKSAPLPARRKPIPTQPSPLRGGLFKRDRKSVV